MNSLTSSNAVAADLEKFKVHPVLGALQGIHFNADGTALVLFRHGCLQFGTDGEPAQFKEPKGQH